jgi:hypothetical protein
VALLPNALVLKKILKEMNNKVCNLTQKIILKIMNNKMCNLSLKNLGLNSIKFLHQRIKTCDSNKL